MIKVSTLLSSTLNAPKRISPSNEVMYAKGNEVLALPGVVAQHVSRVVGKYAHEWQRCVVGVPVACCLYAPVRNCIEASANASEERLKYTATCACGVSHTPFLQRLHTHADHAARCTRWYRSFYIRTVHALHAYRKAQTRARSAGDSDTSEEEVLGFGNSVAVLGDV